ncbi:allophanate hydrolase subunit 1 [Sporosarcina sp. BI001-red]|uniref:5-oxoprolinase subunit PxpB n=1 Tax=Sporosarcina sp. BI001-red TaxID=2282866 RepID=UPI000E244248|nr:5-oxoprolinase subunit PxpB [Sporosarcina sp. BI001-red]REB08048.1 allophanate hydrolase subunit 1 [Sporosarcina sp. BI001-red]
MEFIISPLGDQAAHLEFGRPFHEETEKKIRTVTTVLDEQCPAWVIEYIPSYTSVTIFYDIHFFKKEALPYEAVRLEVERLFNHLEPMELNDRRKVRIPVLYGGESGPDLQEVATLNGLTVDEVIDIHTSSVYTVQMVGFSPGFPFLVGMSPRITAPRRMNPRLRIPPRSVGIAGGQTGIYPIETPGGWQLIGQTPIELFLPNETPPSLLRAGDQLEFFSITKEQYDAYREGDV